MNIATSPISSRDGGDTPLSPCSPTYYGVYLGSPDPEGLVRRHVYKDKIEALKIAKKCKTSRFKIFCSFEEAENFALKGPELTVNSTPIVAAVGEKSSPFKAPISQDLVKFRKDIERGDFESIASLVSKNPRYLVSSGDTPAILQEGARYNALHVAAKFDRPKICEFILHCVTSLEFIQKLYGEDEIKDTVQQRCDILLDLYLNTPDKAANETPLHFASKIGALEIVKVLVSYDKCDKSRRNKQGQTAVDIVASRKSDVSAETKDEIIRLLNSDYYIAVFRPLDPIRPPVIEGPFMMTSTSKLNLKTPLDSEMRMSGVAGPMKYEEALHFKRLWKRPRGSPLVTSPMSPCSPPPMIFSPSPFNKPDKVIERIGRELCWELGIYWVEYWPFLGDFANFKKENGINMLEQYFYSRFAGEKKLYDDCNLNDSLAGLHKEFDKLLIGEKSCCEPDNSNDSYHDSNQFQPGFDSSVSYSLIDKTCQVYANRLVDSLMFPSLETFHSALHRCHELLVSCATDRRYEQVEFDRIHSKIAALVKKKMIQSDSVDISRYSEFLNNFTNVKGQTLGFPLRCICEKIITTLNCDLQESVTPCERGHDKCANEETAKHMWLALEACHCMSYLKNQTRIGKLKKSSVFTKRRLDFKSKSLNNSADGVDGNILDTNENKMEMEEWDSDASYKTPPASPRVRYRCPSDDSLLSNEDENISSEDEMLSADEGAPITIDGDCLKDIDRVVFQALDRDKVNPSKHPYLYLWLHECERKYEITWSSPLVLSPLSPALTKRENLRISLKEINLNHTPLSSK